MEVGAPPSSPSELALSDSASELDLGDDPHPAGELPAEAGDRGDAGLPEPAGEPATPVGLGIVLAPVQAEPARPRKKGRPFPCLRGVAQALRDMACAAPVPAAEAVPLRPLSLDAFLPSVEHSQRIHLLSAGARPFAHCAGFAVPSELSLPTMQAVSLSRLHDHRDEEVDDYLAASLTHGVEVNSWSTIERFLGISRGKLKRTSRRLAMATGIFTHFATGR